MPKKPIATKNSNSQQLTFTTRQEPDLDTNEPTEFGCFSRNWDQEEPLDQLMDDLDAGRSKDKLALELKSRKISQCASQMPEKVF